MACRIGPFASHFYREIHKLGGTVYLNPDGHEWMRAKWSAPIRKYWKISEQMMVKYCDLAICDSVNIEKYIHDCYDGKGIKGRNPKTTFIAYGADLTLSKLSDDDEKLVNWYKEKGLTKKEYYLVVGRFVPENSFEVMIREFMKSKSKKDFVDNVDYSGSTSLINKLKMGTNIIYSQEAKRKFEELVIKTKPDIVHLHIFQHQLSPSILDVCKKYNLPTVYTAHDLKMVCLNYKMMHHGHVCEDCKDGHMYHCALNK